MQEQATPSFDEWVEYCFTKGESEFHSKAPRERSYYAVNSLTVIRPDLFPRSQIPLDEVAGFLVRLFRAPGFIADRFTDDQICDGTWFIFGYGGQYFPYVRRDPVPRELQSAVISSIGTLYTQLFDRLCCERGTDPDNNCIETARLDNTVWMLWDMIGFSLPGLDVGLFPSAPDLVDTGFDVLETVLSECRTSSCQMSALHALAHLYALHPERVLRLINGYLETRQAPPWIRDYACKASRGEASEMGRLLQVWEGGGSSQHPEVKRPKAD